MPQQANPEGAAKIEQMRQAERHKRVAADAAKLLQLSNELKLQIDQSPPDQLSMDAVKKAAEIEKTAHDLNGWMKS
jgi:hypothetical protein